MKGTWEWDGNDWQQVPTSIEPTPRTGAGFALDPRTGTLLLSGGEREKIRSWIDDLWSWDGTRWKQLVPLTVHGFFHTGLFEDPANMRVVSYMYGWMGALRTPLGCAHGWDGKRWTRLDAWDRAFHRGSLLPVYDGGRDLIVLAGGGGFAAFPVPFQTFVVRADGRVAKLDPANSPGPRGGPGLVYHAGSRKVLLFGGVNNWPTTFADTWLWDGVNWVEHKSSNPPPAAFGTWFLTYDSRRDEVVYAAKGQAWVWSPKSGWRSAGSLPVRWFSAITYDSGRDRVIGVRSRNAIEIWEWDRQQGWMMRQPKTAPPLRSFFGFVYAPALGGTLLIGGQTSRNIELHDTWLWDGTSWRQLQTTGMSQQQKLRAPMVYDHGRGRVVAIGNAPSEPYSFWDLTLDGLTTTQPYPRPGEAFQFGVRLPSQAGNPFVLLLARSDWPTVPLLPVPNGFRVLPLHPDPLFGLSLEARMWTTLSAAGSGSLPFRMPNDPALVSFDFHAAGITLGRGGIGAVTNSLPIRVIK